MSGDPKERFYLEFFLKLAGLLKAAIWWIQTHELDHFVKAKKIIKLVESTRGCLSLVIKSIFIAQQIKVEAINR